MFDFLSRKFSSIFSYATGQDKLTEKNMSATLDKVEEAFIEADVPQEVVETFISQLKQDVAGQKVFSSLKPSEHLMKIVHDKILAFMGGKENQENFTFSMPSVVMVLGLQGSGKTTTISKLAHYVNGIAQKRGKKRKILLASVDFYRPAAVDQLEILAKQVGADFYRSTYTNPVQAAQDIVAYSQRNSYDILFLDTAGRLHVDTQMLEELAQINEKIKPKYKILVIDAMTGQESLKIAQVFENKVGFFGAILTKMDSDTRGGLAFAFRYALKKPILFLTSGEKIDDLEFFRPERMASRIIGMGDLTGLLERAQEKIKLDEQDPKYKFLSSGKMTLVDFANQIDMVNNLGSLSKLVKYLPGMGSLSITPDMIEKSESDIKKFKAIINSMTKKERVYPKILDASRKNRISKGAGVTVKDVNYLLERFEQSQQFVKMFKKMG